MFNIDCKLLLDAMNYYESLGYKPIKAPMLVDRDSLEITLPADVHPKRHMSKYYVGSAEQSFYQLLKEGLNPEGSYMLITPCERDDIESDSHLNIFLKVELISVVKFTEEILTDVSNFYKNQNFNPETVYTPTGFDININGIEVGSFGDRLLDGRWIVYGTGLALPRIDFALEQGFGL